jgi:hypothetical protein
MNEGERINDLLSRVEGWLTYKAPTNAEEDVSAC